MEMGEFFIVFFILGEGIFVNRKGGNKVKIIEWKQADSVTGSKMYC